MHGPPLLGWSLVALCAAAGLYCLLRARPGAAGERRAAAAGGDAVMALGMAAMAVPAAVLDTPPWGHVLFAALFGVLGLHALTSAGAPPGLRRLHHAVGAFAMAYMSLAMAAAPAGAHAGHTGADRAPAGAPLLTGLLLVYFAVYVVRTVAGVVPVPAGPSVAGNGPVRPGPDTGAGLITACRLSMAIGMVVMLLTM
ncbi:DUF5134 domain-containing protein [Streptomyces abikoensis]|uniref:DUF5134 domain-containing protein n=1 Tax=Streptomyces abikoensis TaxID=97398 RepID=UPI00167B6989|nr:DUF5134 domain-containing protein [Streptomyces abikoensis]GGP47207.1 DUF5134 domain-containing protein [Streptomyces abikoensis]